MSRFPALHHTVWQGGIAALVVVSLTATSARGQFGDIDTLGPQRAEELLQRYEVGVIVTAGAAPCEGIVATVPVPIEWPEQEVRVLDEDKSALVRRVSYRELAGGVKQMVVQIPYIPAGESVQVIVTLEVARWVLSPPEETSAFVMPKAMDRKVRPYLAPSPKIESRNPKIRALAKEIADSKESAWEKVEAIYDWVRENVKYENGPLKGALAAMNDRTGDCEEMTSLFIAMCRANDIPARTVWVPGHCYPEFYLEDDQGRGYWFPCQIAGTRAFGGIPERRPILQKGDNFSVPERGRERVRYVSEHLKGTGGQPQVKWVRRTLGPVN